MAEETALIRRRLSELPMESRDMETQPIRGDAVGQNEKSREGDVQRRPYMAWINWRNNGALNVGK